MKNDEKTKTQKKPSRRRYILASGFIVLLIISALVFSLFQPEPEPDPASEKIILEVVAEQLNKDFNELTKEDFAQITSLQLRENEFIGEFVHIYPINISDIRVLEKFPNLKDLDLSFTTYKQTAIPKWMRILAKLRIFDFSEKYSIDLYPLEKLSNLKSLSINGDSVKNIKPLTKIANLESLQIQNFEKVKDKKNISKLSSLHRLFLDTASSKVIQYLSKLINLKFLSLGFPEPGNLDSLRKLKNLETLSFNGAGISDIESISSLTNLQELYIKNTNVSNLKPVEELKNLKTIYVHNAPISSLDSIKNLTKLQRFGIYNCLNVTDKQIDDLQKALPNLKIQGRK